VLNITSTVIAHPILSHGRMLKAPTVESFGG
jgi:hypothetical protein